MTDIPEIDSWTDTPSPKPEDFGSVQPSAEQLRREQRAMAHKEAFEKANPGVVIYPGIWSPEFADDDRTEEQIRKDANAGVKLIHNVVALLENIATDAAELASEYTDTGDVSHERLEMLTRPLADVERSSLLAHAEAGQPPNGYQTRWLPPSSIERLVDGLDTVADQYLSLSHVASLGAAHVAGEMAGQAYLWFAAHEDEEDATVPVTLFQGDWELLDTTLEDFDLDEDEEASE